MLLLEGIPLIQYTITAAKESSLVTRVIVNSDDEEILSYAREQKTAILKRPAELAQDNTPMKEVIHHQLDWLKKEENYIPDIIVLLQPTSPLRT